MSVWREKNRGRKRKRVLRNSLSPVCAIRYLSWWSLPCVCSLLLKVMPFFATFTCLIGVWQKPRWSQRGKPTANDRTYTWEGIFNFYGTSVMWMPPHIQICPIGDTAKMQGAALWQGLDSRGPPGCLLLAFINSLMMGFACRRAAKWRLHQH